MEELMPVIRYVVRVIDEAMDGQRPQEVFYFTIVLFGLAVTATLLAIVIGNRSFYWDCLGAVSVAVIFMIMAKRACKRTL